VGEEGKSIHGGETLLHLGADLLLRHFFCAARCVSNGGRGGRRRIFDRHHNI
jgi:hypothetical protein